MGPLAKVLATPVLVAVAALLFQAATTPSLGEPEPVDLRGRTFVVTGASSGLGSWVVEHLYRWNASLVMPVRDKRLGHRIANRLMNNYPGRPKIVVEEMDMASFDSVHSFAERYTGPVDVLINNAAMLGTGEVHRTKDGIEEVFQVNYLSPVLLTSLLLDRIEASSVGRIVHVSSDAHLQGKLDVNAMTGKKILSPDFVNRSSTLMFRFLGHIIGAYADSKLAQVMFSAQLQRRLKGNTVSIAIHPGTFKTKFWTDFNSIVEMFLLTAGRAVGVSLSEQDAPKTLLHVSTHPALQKGGGGKYYSSQFPPLVSCGKPAAECAVSPVAKIAEDEHLQEDVFKVSCELLELTEGVCGREPAHV